MYTNTDVKYDIVHMAIPSNKEESSFDSLDESTIEIQIKECMAKCMWRIQTPDGIH